MAPDPRFPEGRIKYGLIQKRAGGWYVTLVTDGDPYTGWSLSDWLQMLAFEAELAAFPRSLISAVWIAIDQIDNLHLSDDGGPG